jgi:hypothetical protein
VINDSRTIAYVGRYRIAVKRLLPSIAVCLALTNCSPHNHLVVANDSDVELRDVVASGSGFSLALGTIAPRAERRVAIRCRGESGLELRFKAGEREISFGPDGYFEGSGGYLITATVSRDLRVTVKSQLSPSPY